MSFPPILGFERRGILIAAAAVLATVFALLVASDVNAFSGTGGTSTPTSGDRATSARTSPRYERIYRNFPRREKRWAWRTALCESGGNPRAIGGGGAYRGAFQFLRSTWRTSPKSPGGDPIRYTYRVQAVVAVMLKRKMGTRPWPVCG